MAAKVGVLDAARHPGVAEKVALPAVGVGVRGQGFRAVTGHQRPAINRVADAVTRLRVRGVSAGSHWGGHVVPH